jgi:hypothetical protein
VPRTSEVAIGRPHRLLTDLRAAVGRLLATTDRHLAADRWMVDGIAQPAALGDPHRVSREVLAEVGALRTRHRNEAATVLVATYLDRLADGWPRARLLLARARIERQRGLPLVAMATRKTACSLVREAVGRRDPQRGLAVMATGWLARPTASPSAAASASLELR